MRSLRNLLRNELLLRLGRDRYNALEVARAEDGGGDQCPMRMMGRPALAVRGEQGARLFYDESLMRRKGAVPLPIRMLIFGPGSIHGLDGERHSSRKELFFEIITPESVADLKQEVAAELRVAAERWTRSIGIALFDELVEIYGKAVIGWAGVDVPDQEAIRISHEVALIVDGFGVGGTAYPRAALARFRAQKWALKVIRNVRSGRSYPKAGSAAHVLASSDLPDLVAATELLNIVRPTVAVAYFGAPAAVQLLEQYEWRELIAQGSPRHRRAFQLEMRRWYPFAPLLAARTRAAMAGLPAGAFVILDLFGTDRDPASWSDPDHFAPERFLDREPTPFNFVPQGGGYPETGHRCPGEPIAEALLEATVQQLALLRYRVQDGSEEVTLSRIPALPANRVVLNHVEVPSMSTLN